ncbi:MAG TPA: guanine deaminase [Bryobacteraceae bacterium]
MNIVRAAVFHTPRNPFHEANALVAYPDGALAVENGGIVDCGDYASVVKAHPDAAVRDLRGGCLLPGFIDTHVHFPQVRILGGLGFGLLDWLEQLTLPEEARLADAAYASSIAREFVAALAAHGTTTALAFGSHFPPACAALFAAAEEHGLRVLSGLVLSDRKLRPELHQSTEAAYRDSRALIERFGSLSYAVTPRFAFSASEPMLSVCQALIRENPQVLFTTHINESSRELEEVARLFPWAADYLAVYERFDLIGPRSVLAHNVHPRTGELQRLAARGASIAHCPCSNAALGSGIFPMRRHIGSNVRFALGTDVGGGTGFGMVKEALQAYLMQRVASDPMTLSPAQMLYIATRAGAEVLGIEGRTGDFEKGKAADFVWLKPPEGSVLAGALKRSEDPAQMIAALFTLAGAESVREVRVADRLVFASN